MNRRLCDGAIMVSVLRRTLTALKLGEKPYDAAAFAAARSGFADCHSVLNADVCPGSASQ